MDNLLPLLGFVIIFLSVLLAIFAFALWLIPKWPAAVSLRRINFISYHQRPCFFTPAEARFYNVLEDSCADQFKVLAKVRVSDVIEPHAQKRSKQRLVKKLAQLHFDYVLFDKTNLRPVASIFFSERGQTEHPKEDNYLSDICARARLPTLSFKAQQSYELAYVRSYIQEAIMLQVPETAGATELSSETNQPQQLQQKH